MVDSIRRCAPGLVLVFSALASPANPALAVAEEAAVDVRPSPEAVAAERAAYGLPTDAASMDRLSASGDVGTKNWGIAMTAAEEAAMDLPGRMAFADDVSRRVIPVISKWPTYAGEWMDQMAGGSLVVLLTDVDTATTSKVEALMPEKSRGVRFEKAAHTLASLETSVDDAQALWEKAGGPWLLSIGVDTMNNGIGVEVLSADAEAAEDAADFVSKTLGIPVGVDADSEASSHDVTCPDRNHCTVPMKAGIIMRGGSVNGSLQCTVAFHILYQGDVQALSAGHCSYYYDIWYHQGYGSTAFANVQQTLWHSGGRDILRMTFPDAQASDMVFATGNPSQMASAPGVAILNETLCTSLGRSDRVDCGRVEHTSVKYWSDTVGFYVWGGDIVEADINPGPIIGDSGSPLYRERFIEQPPNSYYQRTAIGVITTQFSEYARTDNTLADWGASIY